MDPFWVIDVGARWLVTEVLGWPLSARAGMALHFFLYDTVKIFILLFLISFTMAWGRSFLSPERVRTLLSQRMAGVGNVLAALLGMVTPFCSCSAVTLFIGFVEAGVPLGITLSYLIAAPMINEAAVILLWGLFGLKVAALYVGSGLVLAVGTGWLLGRMGLERYLIPLAPQKPSCCAKQSTPTSPFPQAPEPTATTWQERTRFALATASGMVSQVWVYVLVGVGLGSVLHGYVPTEALKGWLGHDNPLAVPTAVVLGVPLYANAAGVLPVAEALTRHGVPTGTVLAFMMAVTALSLPEMILLKRVLKLPVLLLFTGVLTVGIVLTGYLFNAVL